MALTAPVLLTKQHDTSGFGCGKPALDDYLLKHALANQTAGPARTYMVVDNYLGSQAVVGCYSLAPAAVGPQGAPEPVRKGPDGSIRCPAFSWPA